MRKQIRYRKTGILLILLLLLFALSGCTGKDSGESTSAAPPETESTEAPETESTQPSTEKESSTESGGTAESTEETIREATEEEKTAAYKTCLSFLRDHRAEIAEAALLQQVSDTENVALCDVCGDALPELLVVRNEGGKSYFEIRNLGGDDAGLVCSTALPESGTASSFCFFTIVGDRTLYEYAEENGAVKWYYYDLSGGGITRTELAGKGDGEGSFSYMGEPCSAEDYDSIVSDLLYYMDIVLMYGPDSLFKKALSGAYQDRQEFGMDVDRAIRFLYAAIPRETDGSDDFASLLMDYILNERYLISGAEYVTGADADEITFGLHDMNADGTPELLISNGDPQFSYKTNHVYRFENGRFIYCGDAGFRESVLWTAPGSAYPGVFCSGGHSGFVSHVYYPMLKDGTVIPETVTTHEDTSYKVENHDDKIVTEDYALYQICMANCPAPEREAHYLQMVNAEWITDNGIERLIEEAE